MINIRKKEKEKKTYTNIYTHLYKQGVTEMQVQY